ncbi:hypothetical protein AAG570_008310 [Ranatra chinensis]|uniref:Uncharacterized protein n=1 Tax=Ranatra chinensis TaxID=642074 RepID=A0ABD0Y835_9HEMI
MFECRRLKEFQHYEFWVSASTSVGEGMPSKKVSQSPISRVPARIASFSSQILGGEGSRILPDYSLIVSPLTQNSGGNYSCYAENVFGHDYVVYEIVVISVPQPPNLSVLGVTTDSIELQWKVTTEDSIYITGKVMHKYYPHVRPLTYISN